MDTTAPPYPPMSTPPGPGEPSHPEPDTSGGGGRAGALWLTGLGAFMLFAAAAVFVAVRWDTLSPAVRLGILGAITGSCLLAGRQLRPTLPATSTVLFHLGAFLVPVNTAAVALHLELSWPTFVLVEGAVATLSWWAFARTEKSKVLHVAAGAAVLVLAAGVSATVATGFGFTVPTALLVSGAAVAAEVLRRHRHAIAWATVAGLAPGLAVAEKVLPTGTDVLHTLGMAGPSTASMGIAIGVVCAVVLGRNARRRDDLLLVVLAVAVGVVGLVSTRSAMVTGPWFDVVGIAALFLSVEAAAFVARRDSFWARPAAALAGIFEASMVWLLVIAAGVATWIQFGNRSVVDPAAALAGVLVVAGWLVADLRRQPTDATGWLPIVRGAWGPATLGLAVTPVLAAAGTTTDRSALALVVFATGVALLAAWRPCAPAVAPVLLVAAPLIAPTPMLTFATGSLGALALTLAAVRSSHLVRADEADDEGRSVGELTGCDLAVVALIPVLETVLVLWPAVDHDREPALLLGAAFACWVLAAIADRGRVAPPLPAWGLGLVGRAGAVVTVAAGIVLEPGWWAVLAGVVGFLAIVDAVRHDHPLPLWSLAVAVPTCVGAAAFAVTGETTSAGVAVCVVVPLLAALVALADGRWRPPVVGTLGIAAGAGLLLTSAQPGPFGTALILLGGSGLVLCAAFRVVAGTPFAWLLVTAGTWLHLHDAGIDALEPYVLPVAAVLIAAGWWSERNADEGSPTLSSWVTYGPAVALLVGSALVERFGGGHGAHGVFAGAVAVTAVVVGGTRRLVAPLVLGTATLVALTIHESLGVTRQVPTWGWLAAGGTLLLGAGLLLERLDTGPLESGRRLVDVVHDRYR